MIVCARIFLDLLKANIGASQWDLLDSSFPWQWDMQWNVSRWSILWSSVSWSLQLEPFLLLLFLSVEISGGMPSRYFCGVPVVLNSLGLLDGYSPLLWSQLWAFLSATTLPLLPWSQLFRLQPSLLLEDWYVISAIYCGYLANCLQINTAFQIGSGFGLAITSVVNESVLNKALDPTNPVSIMAGYQVCFSEFFSVSFV